MRVCVCVRERERERERERFTLCFFCPIGAVVYIGILKAPLWVAECSGDGRCAAVAPSLMIGLSQVIHIKTPVAAPKSKARKFTDRREQHPLISRSRWLVLLA